jgi:hypothetical protein
MDIWFVLQIVSFKMGVMAMVNVVQSRELLEDIAVGTNNTHAVGFTDETAICSLSMRCASST